MRAGAAALMLAATTLAVDLYAQPAAQAASAVALAGRTHLSGTSTAAIKVLIPRDARIDLRPKANDLAIDGKGRLTGFVLTAANVADIDRPTVVALDAKACDTDGRCMNRPVRTFTRGNTSSQSAKLPKGPYLLYLVTDGKPVSVDISIAGLSGSTSLAPTKSVHAGIDQPEEVITETTNTIYSNGRSIDVDGPSTMWLTMMTMSGEAWAAGSYGHCIYRGEPPPPPIGFAPGCPAGGGSAIADTVTQPMPYERVGGSLTFAAPGGRWSFGDYYVTAAKADPPKTLSFFLDFEKI